MSNGREDPDATYDQDSYSIEEFLAQAEPEHEQEPVIKAEDEDAESRRSVLEQMFIDQHEAIKQGLELEKMYSYHQSFFKEKV